MPKTVKGILYKFITTKKEGSGVLLHSELEKKDQLIQDDLVSEFFDHFFISPIGAQLAASARRRKFISISCGDAHWVGIQSGRVGSSEVKIFSCGDNTYGQLGLGDVKSRNEPHEVHLDNAGGSGAEKDLYVPNDIFCGSTWTHISAMDLESKQKILFGFGNNSVGQLGNPEFEEEYSTKPILINFADDVAIDYVASGANHCIGLSVDRDRILSWGLNQMGQLGLGTAEPFVRHPQVVSSLSEKEVGSSAVSAVCGVWHSLILFSNKKMFHIGSALPTRLPRVYSEMNNDSIWHRYVPKSWEDEEEEDEPELKQCENGRDPFSRATLPQLLMDFYHPEEAELYDVKLLGAAGANSLAVFLSKKKRSFAIFWSTLSERFAWRCWLPPFDSSKPCSAKMKKLTGERWTAIIVEGSRPSTEEAWPASDDSADVALCNPPRTVVWKGQEVESIDGVIGLDAIHLILPTPKELIKT